MEAQNFNYETGPFNNIFATTGTAIVGDSARPGAGPAIVFSFLLTAIACGFAALCYAEFAARIPIAGSAYTYAYASMGELIAWIIGWDLIVEYAIGNIAVAISWSDYFTSLLATNGINIPLNFTMDFRTAGQGYEAVQQAVGGGTSIEALRAACDAKDAVVTCSQLDAHSAWANAPHIGRQGGGPEHAANLPRGVPPGPAHGRVEQRLLRQFDSVRHPSNRHTNRWRPLA